MNSDDQPLPTPRLDDRSKPNMNPIRGERQKPESPRRHQSFSTPTTVSHSFAAHYRRGSVPTESPPKQQSTYSRSANPHDTSQNTAHRARATSNKPHLGESGLSRHGTLLTANATPARAAAELKSILGSHNARLKSKAALLRVDSGSAAFNRHVTLEQAKPHARVEVDIHPHSNICVQGGHLRGRIRICIRQGTHKEDPISIAGGKIRVIGFECLGEKSKSIFYQCSAMMSSVVPDLDGLYASDRDEEGFSRANEGDHEFPFALYLSMSNENGQARGPLRAMSGISLNYIAVVSLKIKDDPGRRSIAHFYRAIEVWPRLDPTAILSPAFRPLQATATTSPSKGPESGRIKLTASIHRLHWVSGQFCQVSIIVDNDTNKTLKHITISLHRITTIYPHSIPGKTEMDVDSRRTSVTSKQIAESVLEMGQSRAKGHASAKGWWLGVSPGQISEFEHSILIPVDALTVPRGQLFEIEHSLHVAVDSGSRLLEDVQVTLPIRIVGFLSIDPPPSQSLSSQLRTALSSRSPCSKQEAKATALGVPSPCPFTSSDQSSPSDYISSTQQARCIYGNGNLWATGTENDDLSENSASQKIPIDLNESGFDSIPDELELGNLFLVDDTDEVAQHTIPTAGADLTYAGFSDLYYASQEHTDTIRGLQDENYEYSIDIWDHDSVTGVLDTLMEEIATSNDSELNTCNAQTQLTRRNLGVYRRSSLAARVEEKTRLVTAAYLNGSRDDYILQEQHQDSSTPSEERQNSKPYLSLKISPVLGGEGKQSSRGPSITQQLHRHPSSGIKTNIEDKNRQGLLVQNEDSRTYTKPSSNLSPSGTSTVPPTAPTVTSFQQEQEQQELTSSHVAIYNRHVSEIADNRLEGESLSPETGPQTQQNHPYRPTSDTGPNSGTGLPRVPPAMQTDVQKVSLPGAGDLTPTSASSTTSYASATSIGSVSVKDKVRQLEERVRVAAST